MEALIDKAGVLIEALPYIQKFRDAVVVIKFGGSAMEDPELIRGTMRDIVFMECVGMKPVVVHGGGKAISARLKKMGIGTEFINGLRYTCEKTVAVVDDVLHNEVNSELLAAITAAGGRGSQVSGKKFLTAERTTTRCAKTGADLDIGLVGEIAAVDTRHVHAALAEGVVPVIPPLGVGADGLVYNINADVAACRIAEALHARKLVFLSDVPGILRDAKDERTLISHITLGEVDGLIQQGVISGGMVPKIRSAEAALRAGTNKVHMIDGRVRHSLLLEIFTDRGIGTEIVRD
jgi:acetylglutamate kinase